MINYLKHEFTNLVCEELEEIETLLNYGLSCGSVQKSINGFPEIVLKLKDNREISFNSNEYMIYPTHKNSTTPIRGFFGFDSFETGEQKFILGQIFVQKYGLHIEY